MVDKFLALFNDFNALVVFIRLIAAALMGGLIGVERGRHGRAAGLRTHLLICIGAAITSLTSLFISKELGYAGDVARLSAQVISGIGFLGAGTILIRNSSIITGLTTAAGMWTTAAIGIAVGYGFYWGAIFATAICIFSTALLGRLERTSRNLSNVYVELSDISGAEPVIEIIRSFGEYFISFDIIPPKSGLANHVGVSCIFTERCDFAQLRSELDEVESVALVIGQLGA